MYDFLKELADNAAKSGWKSSPVSGANAEKMGFQRGVEVTSPHDTLKLEIFESKDELFCTLDKYGRIELHFSDKEKDKKAHELAALLDDVFQGGIDVEVYKRGDRVLRSVVFVKGANGRQQVAKTVNGLAFFGGHKEVLSLGFKSGLVAGANRQHIDVEDQLESLKTEAQSAGYAFELKKTPDGTLMECTLTGKEATLHIMIPNHEGQFFYAYALESEVFPRELYPDKLKAGFSEQQRSAEIISTLSSLIKKTLRFQPKRSFFKKNGGVIELPVDGEMRQISLARNYFDLPIE